MNAPYLLAHLDDSPILTYPQPSFYSFWFLCISFTPSPYCQVQLAPFYSLWVQHPATKLCFICSLILSLSLLSLLSAATESFWETFNFSISKSSRNSSELCPSPSDYHVLLSSFVFLSFLPLFCSFLSCFSFADREEGRATETRTGSWNQKDSSHKV